jgi:hypothetical protein
MASATGSPHHSYDNLNVGAAERERLIRLCIPEGEPVIEDGDGELKIRCPFHEERTPSLPVSPRKRCFRCLGCDANGTGPQRLEFSPYFVQSIAGDVRRDF